MADLLQDHLLPDNPPFFTNTGVDYFGPFEVRRGRAKVKHYGMSIICSDNGPNFVGAEQELREALAELSQSRINEAMIKKKVWSGFSTHLLCFTMTASGNVKSTR